MSELFKFGIVSVVGRPNVGKSTLVNALVGNDISITSAHSHTTRKQIRAIDNQPTYQIAYVDTPGIHKSKGALSSRMNEYALDALDGVDVVIAVFEGNKDIGPGDRYLAEKLSKTKNLVVVLNKCDVEKDFSKVALRASEYSELFSNAKHLFILSAFTGKNISLLKKEIINMIEFSPPLFDVDKSHEMSDEQLISEIYRETLIRKLRDEIPQGVAVVSQEDRNESQKGRVFDVTVVVARKSHKPIVIGKNGSVLESVGILARKRAEAILGSLTSLRVKVVVDDNWQNRDESLEKYLSN